MRTRLRCSLLAGFIALLLVMPAQAQLKATVSWDPVTTYSDGVEIEAGKTVFYEVFRASKADLTDAVKLTPADYQSTTFLDPALGPNKTYYFYVRAYLVAANPGASSDPVFLRTFPPGKVGRMVVVVTN